MHVHKIYLILEKFGHVNIIACCRLLERHVSMLFTVCSTLTNSYISLVVLSLVHNMTLVPRALRASWKKVFFHQSNCIPDVNFFDNLIGWTLANARDTTLE